MNKLLRHFKTEVADRPTIPDVNQNNGVANHVTTITHQSECQAASHFVNPDKGRTDLKRIHGGHTQKWPSAKPRIASPFSLAVRHDFVSD